MKEVVKKHSIASKLTHLYLIISWFSLAISGFLVYFKMVNPDTASSLMQWHIYFGIFLTIVTIGYVIIAVDDSLSFLKEILNWDKDTILWFKNFGGYPYKFLKIGTPDSTPQTKYNAGQKLYGLLIVVSIIIFIITGFCLYLIPETLGKYWVRIFFNLHLWTAIVATLVMLFVHIPLAIYNFEDLKAMFSFGDGYVSVEFAKKHSPKWFKKEVVAIETSAESINNQT